MRIRRVTAVLLAAMLAAMLMVAAAAAEKEDTATQLRFKIESRYHVSVLMGEECVSVPTGGFELQITPENPSLFQWLYRGENQYTEVLRGLDRALSAYPGGFFRNFRSADGDSRLQFLIGDRIVRRGQTYGGMTVSDASGHSSVFLAANAADIEASVHRALWYVMEARILFKAPAVLDDWQDLNPEGFAYEDEDSILPETAEDPDEWFVSEAARQNEKEDRAAVFEAYMTGDSTLGEGHPHLRAKLDFLLVRIRGVFKVKNFGR